MDGILYRDPDLLLVEKPVGVLSQEDPNGGDSLPERLKSAGTDVKPVHRLDRTTGGVMAYAITQEAAAGLSRLVGDHERFVKTYLAVVEGKPEGSGEWEDWLFHDVRKNKTYVTGHQRKGVKKAVLSFHTLETVTDEDGTLSLVEVRLHTGRTHQIRVQFASRRFPLVGDSRYGGKRKAANPALWSHTLTFPHPVTGKPVSGVSEPPWEDYPWNLFRNK